MGATIVEYWRLRHITYYTVIIDDAERSEFERFIIKIQKHQALQDSLVSLVNFVKIIGDKKGFVSSFFKPEGAAFRFKEVGEVKDYNCNGYGLRLYCLPINKNIIILFNGCYKTTPKVKDCKNCSDPFNTANLISSRITRAIAFKDILVSDDNRSLLIDDHFEL
ncbi:hypothetical protein [Flavihumibacter sp. CACIAM 22H1]|uniref:hypothetical protein n=1 Tax=Flavihumibacter sp. CACIAM 22H1 TaxID=1812911 RepID=UPI0007A8F3A4|nr:hypothetical protein [Flavihumibacter sp. CACIAM 22H1]KYP16640.1 MAG: hypothetical protein A1D16_09520 [Flavihumibacter sp. CACIAM 22H1]